MRELFFTKMQGLGNDFIVVEGPRSFDSREIAELCDRRFGVGADGVLVVTRTDQITMEYWNADGSAAEMCGNGLRCVARYVYDKNWTQDRNFAIQTPDGLRTARILDDGVEVELGPVRLAGTRTIDGVDHQLVEVGNPHLVRFVEDPSQVDVEATGRSIQDLFPGGINVEFATPSNGVIRMRVWERGVGETLACGTGMAAVAAATIDSMGGTGPVVLEAPGGRATVDLRDGVAWLRGPAEYSFRGNVAAR